MTKSSWTFNALHLHLHDEHPHDGDTSWLKILSASEISRSNGMASKTRAHTFLSARAYLRQHIANMTNLVPALLDIVVPPAGKPYLARPEGAVSFSISHSHGKILIGIMPGSTSCGVDLQYMDDSVDIERIAERFFTDNENALVAAAANARHKAFDIWCRKEAQYKIGENTPAHAMTAEDLGSGFMMAAGYA